MNLLWFIPTFGDGRYLGSIRGSRETNYAYLRQIAEAVDSLGYYGALLPTGRTCDDSWIVAAALIPQTERMRFLVAVRPGLMTPTITGRMVATFDQISNGRLLINVVAGGDPVELAGDGLHLKHDQRYELTGEFLHIFRRALNGESVDFFGSYLQVQDAKLFRLGVQKPYPELWFGGSSPAGQRVAAEHVDVYLTWGEPPDDVAAKIGAVQKAASSFGRSLRFGLRSISSSGKPLKKLGKPRRNSCVTFPMRVSRPRKRPLNVSILKAKNAWFSFMAVSVAAWKSVRIFGLGSAWCAVEQALHWLAIPKRSQPD